MAIKVSETEIQKHIDSLAKIGNLGPKLEDGFLRSAWSDEESEAINYIKNTGEKFGLKSRYDDIGNFFLTLIGNQNTVLQVGSHLDTVPNGGLFDGGAGIIAGLEALIEISKTGYCSGPDLELVIWRGEESATFGSVTCGSKAAFGMLPPSMLERTYNGVTLKEAIKKQGFNPEPIETNQPTISLEDKDRILGMIELHIEQATFLENNSLDIGIVNSIRGPSRWMVEVTGEAAHSGSTPMGIEYRSDANLAIGYMLVELDKLVSDYAKSGNDIVQTIGIINSLSDFNKSNPNVYKNALTKVSPYGYFTHGFRSTSSKVLDEYENISQECIKNIAKKFNVDIKIELITKGKPLEKLDEKLESYAIKACDKLDYKYTVIPSGGFHDVAIVASQTKSDGSNIPGSLIFIPCKDGISHNPKEFTTTQAITKGANVLTQILLSYQ